MSAQVDARRRNGHDPILSNPIQIPIPYVARFQGVVALDDAGVLFTLNAPVVCETFAVVYVA